MLGRMNRMLFCFGFLNGMFLKPAEFSDYF